MGMMSIISTIVLLEFHGVKTMFNIFNGMKKYMQNSNLITSYELVTPIKELPTAQELKTVKQDTPYNNILPTVQDLKLKHVKLVNIPHNKELAELRLTSYEQRIFDKELKYGFKNLKRTIGGAVTIGRTYVNTTVYTSKENSYGCASLPNFKQREILISRLKEHGYDVEYRKPYNSYQLHPVEFQISWDDPNIEATTTNTTMITAYDAKQLSEINRTQLKITNLPLILDNIAYNVVKANDMGREQIKYIIPSCLIFDLHFQLLQLKSELINKGYTVLLYDTDYTCHMIILWI